MATSSAFLRLDPRIQHFLWSQGWGALRAVQEFAIPPVLAADRDVIIAASTASGKTEAAFLPALTRLLSQNEPGLIIYISPLKALINDQFLRLDRLCEDLDVPVWPWHADVSAARKAKFARAPEGVLLITPESLEAMLCNRGSAIAGLFRHLRYLIIDELHAFIGSERGKQLQSLMHRTETALGRAVPRIGLSATLGDVSLAARFLRPGRPCVVVDIPPGDGELRVVVKGYQEKAHPPGKRPEGAEEHAPLEIAQHLFTTLRGTNNLVFPNSRREVERYTHLLSKHCERERIPNEFWPHHGNLSKEIRYETEAALKERARPATAVCTSTLELGIDIGAVRSVCQIGTPPSVASLRQRLGRSGRREGESAILRGYVIEDALDGSSPLGSRLRLATVQTAAAVSLLIEQWFEPAKVSGAHLSTLIQQLLSAIAQHGGLTAAEAYRLLCAGDAPFSAVPTSAFAELLRHLGQEEILVQDNSGLLLHGRVGEKLVNHYTFYAAFASDEEFRIVAGGRTLGTLPISQMLSSGQRILFGGRTWRVESIDEAQKTIYVAPASGGAPPLFSGGAGRVHTAVRQRMREIYMGSDALGYLDSAAQSLVDEGRRAFSSYELTRRDLIDQGATVLIATWLGDDANEALACLLTHRGLPAAADDLGIEVRKSGHDTDEIERALAALAFEPAPSIDALLSGAQSLMREKWDWLLPPSLLRLSYASLHLDLPEAYQWLRARAARKRGDMHVP